MTLFDSILPFFFRRLLQHNSLLDYIRFLIEDVSRIYPCLILIFHLESRSPSFSPLSLFLHQMLTLSVLSHVTQNSPGSNQRLERAPKNKPTLPFTEDLSSSPFRI